MRKKVILAALALLLSSQGALAALVKYQLTTPGVV